MKRLLLAAILAVLVLGVLSPVALAGGGNPSGTGHQASQHVSLR
jgi:hypothetical protein